MLRRTLKRRIHARLRGERGFTIVETVVALGVMFSVLVSLAYVVTSGLTYQQHARTRQTANALANQVMERARGLPYEAIQNGMLDTDLAGDANIVSCDAGTTKRLYACTAGAGAIPGTGELIVQSPSLPTTDPLVPHRSATAPNTNPTLDGTTYRWSTYVTQGTLAGGDPGAYRITVEVTWAAPSGTTLIRVQSMFWSPVGCRSTATHPYAAPCQAFFYGKATVPTGTITIEPTGGTVGLRSTPFEQGVLNLGGATASVQQEQVVQALASFSVTSAALTTSGTSTTYGVASGASSADTDPNTSSPFYDRDRCGVEVTCGSDSGSSPAVGSADRITFAMPATATAESVGTAHALTAQPCPPSNVATAENDNVACAGASYVQPSDITAIATLTGTTPSLGSFDVARVSPPASSSPAPIRVFAHRVTNPTSSTCTPAANTDGCLALTASRSLGTIAVGGLPTGFGTPSGWLGSFVRITSFSDSATAAVGSGSPFPTTSASPPAGQLRIYNGSGYTSYDLNSGTLASSITSPSAITSSIGGTNVTATFTLDNSQTVNASSATSSTPSSGGSADRTATLAQATPPVLVMRYRLSIQGTGDVMDLTVTINLGTLDIDGAYAAKPPEGS